MPNTRECRIIFIVLVLIGTVLTPAPSSAEPKKPPSIRLFVEPSFLAVSQSGHQKKQIDTGTYITGRESWDVYVGPGAGPMSVGLEYRLPFGLKIGFSGTLGFHYANDKSKPIGGKTKTFEISTLIAPTVGYHLWFGQRRIVGLSFNLGAGLYVDYMKEDDGDWGKTTFESITGAWTGAVLLHLSPGRHLSVDLGLRLLHVFPHTMRVKLPDADAVKINIDSDFDMIFATGLSAWF